MGDYFVDVTYRGLEVGRRIKLRDVAADAAYLEVPTPMPVGTSLDIVTDEGVHLGAVVIRVHEQIGGHGDPPGMRIRPVAAEAEARSWWTARARSSPPAVTAAPVAPAAPVVAAPAPAEPNGANGHRSGNGEVLDEDRRAQALAVAVVAAEAEVSGSFDAVPLADLDPSSSGELDAVDAEDSADRAVAPGNGAGGTADKAPTKRKPSRSRKKRKTTR